MINYSIYHSPIGKLLLGEEDEKLTLISFDSEGRSTEKERSPFLKEVAKQLDEYFKGERREFQIPLNPKGTEFQKRVWQELTNIPYGETCSYKDIAERVNNPKGYRAVGLANNRNPITIVIPCHRVIGSDGKLVGYGGGLHIKRFLLELEQR